MLAHMHGACATAAVACEKHGATRTYAEHRVERCVEFTREWLTDSSFF